MEIFLSLNREGNNFPSLNRDGNCFSSLFRDGNVFPSLFRDGKISVSKFPSLFRVPFSLIHPFAANGSMTFR